jgi:glutathionylspermidine synthase
MRRHRITARPDWQARAQKLDFTYANVEGGSYWDESACWELTEADVLTLEAATVELNRLCQLAVDHAVRHGRAAILGIPDAMWPVVAQSWRNAEPSLYGRMDLRWDGVSPPKLLEYNADTPTTLYEASVVQWDWLTCVRPEADQFNGLHEALIARWREFAQMGALAGRRQVHFTCMTELAEDRGTVEYLRDTAMQAGIDAPFIAIGDIGWDGRQFLDLRNDRLRAVFKLYPWDWLLRDQFGGHILHAETRWIEPAWRLAVSSKGMLALLWELFPDHPNLLPAYREAGRIAGPALTKPLFGREGANIVAPGFATAGPYGEDAVVHQAWCPLPCCDGRYPVFGSWLIGDQPQGLGIREDATPITNDLSCFVPHYFLPAGGS